MSSRALRRLQADSGLAEIAGHVDDDGDSFEENEPSPKPVSKRKNKKKAAIINPFELLNEDDGGGDEREVDQNSDDEEDTPVLQDQVKTSKKKRKKNKKKGKENQEDLQAHDKGDEDEVAASVEAVNRLLGAPSPAIAQDEGSNFVQKMKPLLHIDYRNLNADNEMKRMFGSELFRQEQQQQRNRRQRNRPLIRSTRLVQPKDTWHTTGGCGLTMKFLGEGEGFLFEHSQAYQKLQHQFLDGIESGMPENIFGILQENPYHIDTLISLADFYIMNEDFQTGAECIEKALYGMECAFHSMFNLAAGNCYLDYKRRENRCLYICLFKHIVNLGRRGCNRTALEFCKVLLSLDPVNDPLNCLSMIDYYALRSEQYEYLLRLEAEVSYTTSQLQTPNFAFSVALAYYKLALKDGGDTTKADEMLQDRLLLYPMMLLPILDKCSVMPDKRVESHRFFSTVHLDDRSSELKRLISLYASRCEACWKEPSVMAWLERNVNTVMDIVDKGDDPRIERYATMHRQQFKHPPPSIIRHYSLSGIPIPSHITTRTLYAHDPYPPSDSIAAYERPPRRTRAATNDRGIMRLLLQSLMPSYNPNELANDANQNRAEVEVGAEGGARAIPQQLQESVNAIMDAMRNLLNSATVVPQENEAEPVDEENEREWEEEEDDYYNQQH